MSNICRGLVHTYLCDFEIVCISFFQLYLTFHTYGQYILYPWGYARRDAVDKKDLHRMGKIGANAAKRVSGHKYSVGSAAKMLYPAAGMCVFFFHRKIIGSCIFTLYSAPKSEKKCNLVKSQLALFD